MAQNGHRQVLSGLRRLAGELTVTITDDTRFRQCDGSGDSWAIDFADLQIGKSVKVSGQVAGSAYVAVWVIQY